MNDIAESVLHDALSELRSLKNARLPEYKLQEAGWEDIVALLRRLDDALSRDDRAAFEETLRTLVARLPPPKVRWRGSIVPAKGSAKQPPPPPVWEAFNHIIDRLQRPAPLAANEAETGEGRLPPRPVEERDGHR